MNDKKEKILLIDDDQQVRDVIRHALESSGYEALMADNGVTGLKVFKEAGPKVVITDLFMPEKEGLETIQEIKALNSEVKIIAISGGSVKTSLDFLPLATKLGANAALEKPFSISTLLEEIKKLLN